MAAAGAACSFASSEDAAAGHAGIESGAGALASRSADFGSRPLVEVVPRRAEQRVPLDPSADPRTPLGLLRALRFPVWTPDLDWAFPPEVCRSAWELDALAVPDAGADARAAGDVGIAAALSVMRFEYMMQRAFAEPGPLMQLCVSVVSVDPLRGGILRALQSRALSGEHAPPGIPELPTVALVASAPAQVLAVACTAVMTAGAAADGAGGQRFWEAFGPDGSEPEGTTRSHDSGTRLGAYLLLLSHGIEDQAVDVSWRVARVHYDTGADCDASLEQWRGDWADRASVWSGQGQAWLPHAAEFTPSSICRAEQALVPTECPQDWIS